MSGNIRIPPESTGPRIATTQRYVLEFDAQTIAFAVGDVVTGATSSATGEVTGVMTDGYAANAGRLYLKEVTGTFQDNENLQVSAVTRAVVDTSNESFAEWSYQQNVLTDADDPTRNQHVDQYGSAQMTFKDGAPSIGAFGGLTTGETQIIKEYRFAYDGRDSDFYDTTASGATLARDANKGVMLFTNPTTTGASVSRTSHFYHPYVPGIGHRVEMTIQVGDTGKANVTRRWGYYDDDNGIFWELNGTDLRLCLRTNVTGSVVDAHISSTDFNVDALDGNGESGFDIDVSKANIFWIDLQWLGAGRVRSGIILSDGSKQVAHVYENANIANLPYMKTATLPLRVEQINTGTAASTSELNWSCGVVKHDSKVDIIGPRFSTDSGALTNVQTSDGDLPIMAVRPKTTFNSETNRAIFRFVSLSLGNVGASNDTIIYRVWATDSTNLTAASFSSIGTTSAFEVDTSSTAIANSVLAKQIASFMVMQGSTEFIQIQTPVNVHDVELFLDADGTTQKALVVTADNVGTANTEAWMGVNWMELHN